MQPVQATCAPTSGAPTRSAKAPPSSTRTAPGASSSTTASPPRTQHSKMTDCARGARLAARLARAFGSLDQRPPRRRPAVPRHRRRDRAVRRPARHRHRHLPRADQHRHRRFGLDRQGRRPGRRSADHDRASACSSRCRRCSPTTGCRAATSRIAELLSGFSTDVLANITSRGAVKPGDRATRPRPRRRAPKPAAAPTKP